jgi:hypothetical protein
MVNRIYPYPLVDIFRAKISDPAIPEMVPIHLRTVKIFMMWQLGSYP